MTIAIDSTWTVIVHGSTALLKFATCKKGLAAHLLACSCEQLAGVS